eukprot:gb/GEZJ01008577.1/.p1 GENE.gb/GEZJ01008577.1/~~gb/GEZJ01008577.1/.p1  ORF type:complete len:122 (-),score=8.05 gb/GEZJ01008577.1/:11-376(-)
MRGKTDEEKSVELLCHLESSGLKFYYSTFEESGSLTKEEMDSNALKKQIMAELNQKSQTEDDLYEAVSGRSNSENLLYALAQLDALYRRVGSNDTGFFGLLRNAIASIEVQCPSRGFLPRT